MTEKELLVPVGAIEDARRRIDGHILRTPLVASAALSEFCGSAVCLKLEHHQLTGSFKLRGATNTVLSLSDEEKRRGVATFSTGNHGRALAHAAKNAGVRCIVCMSELVPQNKIEGIRSLGAEIRIVGRSQDDAQKEVERLAGEEKMVAVSPIDDPRIIAGQGTLGLEILDDMDAPDTVLVPLSGGGLISGVARAIKFNNPKARVIGISMERGAAMAESLHAGKPVLVEEVPSLADSLGGGIGLDNRWTFAMTRELVDDVVLLNEDEIAGGISYAYWQEGEIVEGAGAVGIAALLAGRIDAPGRCVALLTGCNIDRGVHHRLISGEMVYL
ncbi:MAG: hydroxyectoine utilization dehydratase EutB [Hyphomicrobiales bacterium]|nr:hydroxyectoine utilization dehydratase EutB [Hyphomicrobiales bacterium]